MIANEGRFILFLVGVGIIVLHAFFYLWGFLAWPLFFLVMWFYRDPVRIIPAVPLGIVSPADGTIVSVEKTHDPFVDREANCIRIQMSWSSVFVLRGATEGKIVKHWLHDKKIDKDDRKRHVIWIQTDEKDDVVIALEAGARYAKMHCYVASGERIGQGKRCGFIPFGTEVEVYIPKKARILVEPGQKVLAGNDVLAELIH